MRSLVLAMVMALPIAAQAQEVPGLFEVVGVAADDTLNVRTGPGAGFDVIGEFAPDASGIEVTQIDWESGWGRVNFQETAGWVSMAYLGELPLQRVEGLPRPLICYGTEPFWDIEFRGDDSAVLSVFGELAATFPEVAPVPASNLLGRSGLMAGAEGQSLHAVVTTRSCSDGMSDRLFGYEINMILDIGEGVGVWSGCCTVAQF